MLRLPTFWTEPPTHIRVYSCPACKETISVDSQSCRFCHVTTDVKMAEQRWLQNQHVTTAVSRANTFSASTGSVKWLTGISLYFLIVNTGVAEIWVVCNLLAISYGAQWLNHNSSIVTNDADYAKSVTKVKRAMVVWALALLVQVAVYLGIYGFSDWEKIFLIE